MIQIPLEIGDTILAGRFKNKKIKVNEIGTDDFGNPTVNGRSILKIRIPKLYQKQETEMKTSIKEALTSDKHKTIDKKLLWETEKNVVVSKNGLEKSNNIKESVNPFQKAPLEVKIKQTDGSWHIYLQTVDGEECITMTGWGTKEQAEHAAMMKGYSFDANKSNETPTRDTPKYTGYEKVRSEKPEEMKLSKEKKIEIKLEGMIKKVMKEETATDFKIGDYVSKGTSPKGFIYWIHPTGHWIKLEDPYGNKEAKMFDVSGFKVKTRGIPKKITAERYGKKKALNELEITDVEKVQKIEEMARLSDEFDRIKAEMEKIKKQLEPLDEEITKWMEEADASGERALETKNILITIKKKGNPKVEIPAYKERFERLYSRVNGALKKQEDEYWESIKKFKKIPTSIGVQYKNNESKINEDNVFSRTWSKVKSYFGNLFNKIVNYGKIADQGINELKRMV